MVKGHTDQLALLVLQAVEELLDHGLSRLGFFLFLGYSFLFGLSFFISFSFTVNLLVSNLGLPIRALDRPV